MPSVADTVDTLTGTNNTGKIVSHVCAVAWSLCLQLMLVDWAYTEDYLLPGVLGRLVLAVMVLGAMLVLFVKTSTPEVEFTTQYADNTAVYVYLLIYLGYVAFTCSEITFMCVRLTQMNWEARRRASWGFAFAALGGVLGIAYAVSKGGYLISYRIGRPWSLTVEESVSPSLAGLASLALIGGITVPSVIGRLKRRQSDRSTLGSSARSD
ncbi:hypothetical protein [Streptomyces sp. RTd22]|uniref:hypothetical protein n=1 Tax=Streptomyces sp. RTd22 TaxID=1841249 RepID=UPI00131D8CA7|nr:hypothetical protein [Streptomyces sp. RTd22]